MHKLHLLFTIITIVVMSTPTIIIIVISLAWFNNIRVLAILNSSVRVQ
jgi:hypothetical protein